MHHRQAQVMSGGEKRCATVKTVYRYETRPGREYRSANLKEPKTLFGRMYVE